MNQTSIKIIKSQLHEGDGIQLQTSNKDYPILLCRVLEIGDDCVTVSSDKYPVFAIDWSEVTKVRVISPSIPIVSSKEKPEDKEQKEKETTSSDTPQGKKDQVQANTPEVPHPAIEIPWYEEEFAPMGRIINADANYITIKPNGSEPIVLSHYCLSDKNLKDDVRDAIRNGEPLNIEVLWACYEGKPIAVVRGRKSLEINGWAKRCEQFGEYERACALYQFIVNAYPERAKLQKKLLGNLKSMLGIPRNVDISKAPGDSDASETEGKVQTALAETKERRLTQDQSEEKYLYSTPEKSDTEQETEEKKWTETPMDAMGEVSGVFGDLVIVTRQNGNAITVHMDAVADSILRQKLLAFEPDKKPKVLIGEYEGEVTVLTGLLTPAQMRSLAVPLEADELTLKMAYGLHESVIRQHPEATIQQQKIKKLAKMISGDTSTEKNEASPAKSDESTPAITQAKEPLPTYKRPMAPMGRIMEINGNSMILKEFGKKPVEAELDTVIDKELAAKIAYLPDDERKNAKLLASWSMDGAKVCSVWGNSYTAEQLFSQANVMLSQQKKSNIALSIFNKLLEKYPAIYSRYKEKFKAGAKKEETEHKDTKVKESPTNAPESKEITKPSLSEEANQSVLFTVPLPDKKQTDINVPVPPMGHITKLASASVTIKTIDGKECNVSKTLLDRDIVKQINVLTTQRKTEAHIPVLWAQIDGMLQIVIGALTPQQIHSKADTASAAYNHTRAVAIMEMLMERCDNKSLEKRLNVFRNRMTSSSYQPSIVSPTQSKTHNNLEAKEKCNFKTAEDLLKRQKRYEEAIQYYQKSIEEGNKEAESHIGIIYCYGNLGKTEKAYEYIEEEKLLDDEKQIITKSGTLSSITTWLENNGYYEDAIVFYKQRMKHLERREDTKNNQLSTLFDKIARCYQSLEKYEEAEEYTKKAIELGDANQKRASGNLLKELKGEYLSDEKLFEDLCESLYTKHFEDTWEEIFPHDKPHNKEELESIKKEKNNARGYEEYARIHLQLAGLERELNGLDSDARSYNLSTALYNSALARYKNEKIGKDELRFLLCESVATRSTIKGRTNALKVYDIVAKYLQSFVDTGTAGANGTYVFIHANSDKVLDGQNLFEQEDFFEKMAMIMQYRTSFHFLVKKIFESNYQQPAIMYLSKNGINIGDGDGKEAFKRAWAQLIKEKHERINKLGEIVEIMCQSNSFDDIIVRYDKFEKEARFEYADLLSGTDLDRIKELGALLRKNIREYFTTVDLTYKEMSYGDSRKKINDLIEKYAEAPTRFSYDSLVTLLRHMQKIMDGDFKDIIERKKPTLSFDTTGDCYLDLMDRTAEFDIVIRNEAGKSPARNYALAIAQDEKMEEHLEGFTQVYDTILGGMEVASHQKIRISDSAIEEGALPLSVSFTYDAPGMNGSQKIQLNKQLSLQLQSEFHEIPNKYNKNLSSSAPTKDMFFGREEEIKKFADSLCSTDHVKQLLAYGQRRSGKTTFLEYLRQELVSRTPKPLCVKFSYELLDETKMRGGSDIFFWYIMSNVVSAVRSEDPELDYYYLKGDFSGNDTAKIDSKIMARYRESNNPAGLFIEDMTALHAAMDATEKWTGRKIILMIDEFTGVYGHIKRGMLPKDIMKQWKAVTQEKGVRLSAIFIGQDSVRQFKSEPYAENAFGVIECVRLGYLSDEAANKMIIEPTQDENDHRSRFVSDAVPRIKELTACNPYFLMIFMDKMVAYMNRRRINRATENDVEKVLSEYLSDINDSYDSVFHSLLSADNSFGDDWKNDTKLVLRLIAQAMERKDIEGRTETGLVRDAAKLDPPLDEDRTLCIIDDLKEREVIEQKDGGYYNIRIIMFQRALLAISIDSRRRRLQRQALNATQTTQPTKVPAPPQTRTEAVVVTATRLSDALIGTGAPVTGERFVGHQAELDNIVHQFYEDERGQNFSIHGLPRIGKTSLLKNAREIYRNGENFNPKHLTPYISMDQRSSITDVYMGMMSEMMNEVRENNLDINGLGEILKQRMEAVQYSSPADAFSGFIKELTKAGISVRMVLDEFDNIIKLCRVGGKLDDTSLISIFARLRCVATGDKDGMQFRMAIISRNNLTELEPDNDMSKICGICTTIDFKPFNIAEKQLYWNRLKDMDKAGIITDELIKFVEDYAGGVPNWLDVVNKEVFTNYGKDELILVRIRTNLVETQYKSVFSMLANSSSLSSNRTLDSKLMQVIVGPQVDLNLDDVDRLRNYGIIEEILMPDNSIHYHSLSPQFEDYLRHKQNVVPLWENIAYFEQAMRDIYKKNFLPQCYPGNWEDTYGREVLKNRMDRLRHDRKRTQDLFGVHDYNSHLVDYFYISDFATLVEHDWDWFKQVFGGNPDDKERVKEQMTHIANCRNPLAHSNGVFLSAEDREKADRYIKSLMTMIERFKQ